jgi:hypothetical protein
MAQSFVTSAARKLTTKPVWWWERRQKYGIRAGFKNLPPIAVNKGRKRFVVLTTPESLGEALWTAWSWYRFLQTEDFELELAVDGELSRPESASALQLFPGVTIYSAQSTCAYVCEREPTLQTFLYGYPMGRKLALMLACSDRSPILYSDHDVLAFNPPDELFKCVDKNVPCYFLEEVDGTRDAQVAKSALSLGLDYLPQFNSGFLYLPKGTLPIELAARILATWRPPANSWFTEQTALSVMLQSAKAEALPQNRYVISARRQFYFEKDVDYRAIVARHFTGTVRHVMYKFGMPEILKQSRILSSERKDAR